MVPTAHLGAAHRLGKVLCGLPQLVHKAPFPVEFVPIHGRDVRMESVEQVVDRPLPGLVVILRHNGVQRNQGYEPPPRRGSRLGV